MLLEDFLDAAELMALVCQLLLDLLRLLNRLLLLVFADLDPGPHGIKLVLALLLLCAPLPVEFSHLFVELIKRIVTLLLVLFDLLLKLGPLMPQLLKQCF